jgi:hypothetical protein
MTSTRFVVTSIAWTEVSEVLGPATQRLQEAFGALLSDHDFGGSVGSVCIFVIANQEESEAVELKQAKPFSFQQSRDWQGQKLPGKTLYVKVFFTHQDLDGLAPEALLSKVSEGICRTLQRRPFRVPKGFDFEGLAIAAAAVASGFVK